MDEALAVARACNFMVGRMNPTLWSRMGRDLHAEVRVDDDQGCVIILNARAATALQTANAQTADGDAISHAFIEGAASGLSFAERLVELGRLGRAKDLAEFSEAEKVVAGRRWRLAWIAFFDTPKVTRTEALPYFPEELLVPALATALEGIFSGVRAARAKSTTAL